MEAVFAIVRVLYGCYSKRLGGCGRSIEREYRGLAMMQGDFPKPMVLGAVLLTISLLSGCVSHPVGESPYTGTSPAGGGSSTTAASQAQQSNVIQADPAWFSCEKDRDCALERGVCGQFQAVNSKFLAQFEQYRQQMNQSVSCSVNEGPLPSQPVRCQQHRCTEPGLGGIPGQPLGSGRAHRGGRPTSH
jgi:hypothetical protein